MIDATWRWIITPAHSLRKCIPGEASPRGFGDREQISDNKLNKKKKKNHSVEAIAILMTTTPQCPVLTSLNRHEHHVTGVLFCTTEVTKPVVYWSYEVLGLNSLYDFFYPFFFKYFSSACPPWEQEKYNASFTLFPVVPSFADIFCQSVQYFIIPFWKLTLQSLRKNTGLYQHKL